MKTKNENKPSTTGESVNAFGVQHSDFHKEIMAKGWAKCPTCGKKSKQYKRRLTPMMCAALIEVLKYYRHNPNVQDTLEYFNIHDLFKDNPLLKVDFSKLQYWDLIEAKAYMNRKKLVKVRNQYRISENGIKFAQREVAIPTIAIVVHNQVCAHVLGPDSVKTIEEVLHEGDLFYANLIDPNKKIRYR